MNGEYTMRKILVTVLLLLFLTATAQAVGEQAVDFSLKDLKGKTLRLNDQKGSVVLLSFWMTWCSACKVEMPIQQRLYNTYKDKGFSVWSITSDTPSDLPKVRSIVRRHKLTFPVLHDSDSRVNGLYNPRSIFPYTVLIDREGKVVWTHAGFKLGEEVELENQIKKALGL